MSSQTPGGSAPSLREHTTGVSARTALQTPTGSSAALISKVCPTCNERFPGDFRVCPRDATELADIDVDDDVDALLGATVSDTFSIVKVIGEGGMARVYEARHIRLPNKRFAVKVLHPMYAQQPAIVARFAREAEAASGIAHPNVVDVYDVGTTPDGRPYLVSEFLQGQDFSDLLDERGKITAPAAVHVVRQVCRALAAAHAHGVVHRDVKPENVFLVGDMNAPVVKVLDFGISKFDNGGGATLTQTGMIMGTPGYMPPEQARGAKTDHRADVYGVGAMLYRAVTGKLPFDSEDAGEALGMVLTAEPIRPRKLEPSIPEALELIIQRAMAKNPEDRYGSMQELDERLAPFDAEVSASVSLMPPPPPGSAVRPTLKSTTAMRAPSSSDVERDTRNAKLARPTLVGLTFASYAWLVGCAVDVAGAVLARLRGAPQPTATEKMVVAITVVAISLTPLVFWLRKVGSAWRNSVRAVELAGSLRRVVLAATVPYAFLALALRALAPFTDLRWAPWLVFPSFAIAAIAVIFQLLARRRTG